MKEYVYFITCRNPESFYLAYREDPNIIYHAKLVGFCNLWIVAKEKIDIPCSVVCEGFRSDYYMSYAPDRTWESALKIIEKKVKEFNRKDYARQHLIETHLDETVLWDEKDQLIYEYFKYNLRKPITSLIRQKDVSSTKIYDFIDRLPEVCTVSTAYYPEGFSSYDAYLFMIETEYEDFIIDLFSEFPTTSTSFKVNDRLFTHVAVPKKYMRDKDLKTVPRRLYIPHALLKLQERGIVKSSDYSIVEYYWGKDI